MEKIVETINLLRTNPLAFKSTALTVSKALKRIKKNKPAQELEEFANELDNLEPLHPLKLNKGLNKLCQQELDNIVKNKKKDNIIKNFEQLKKDGSKFVKNFNKLFMSYDKGELDFLVCRIIVSEYDTLKQNRKNYLSNDYNYVGVAFHEDSEGEENTVIIFADYVEEIYEDFTFEDFSELKKAFDLFDINKTELLDAKELKKALRQLNFDEENPTLFSLISELDTPENEEGVDFRTFCLTFDKKLSDNKTKAGLQRLFNLFIDDPHSHSLTETSVRKLCKNLDIPLHEGEAREIIERASLNGKEITFDEFYNIMTAHINDAKVKN